MYVLVCFLLTRSPVFHCKQLSSYVRQATQTRDDLHTSSVNTNLGKRSVRYKASKIWNSLPDSLSYWYIKTV